MQDPGISALRVGSNFKMTTDQGVIAGRVLHLGASPEPNVLCISGRSPDGKYFEIFHGGSDHLDYRVHSLH